MQVGGSAPASRKASQRLHAAPLGVRRSGPSFGASLRELPRFLGWAWAARGLAAVFLTAEVGTIARSRPLPCWLPPSLFERSEPVGARLFRPVRERSRIAPHVLALA